MNAQNAQSNITRHFKTKRLKWQKKKRNDETEGTCMDGKSLLEIFQFFFLILLINFVALKHITPFEINIIFRYNRMTNDWFYYLQQLRSCKMSSFPYSVFIAIENLPATRKKKQILIFCLFLKSLLLKMQQSIAAKLFCLWLKR